jgi:RNA polymerase sigma-32 factor
VSQPEGPPHSEAPPSRAEETREPAASRSAAVVPAERGLERAEPLSRYLSELAHHAPISREEEHALAVRWVEHGDVEAARRLVLANLRLVVKIAMEYRRAWTNTLDLIQEGNVGLMQAVQRYDPYRGVKLSSYAVYWIRAYILKYLIDNFRQVRMGSSRAERKLFFRINREKRELERQGFEAEPKLLAERLDVSEQDVISMERRLAQPELSIQAPVRGGEDSTATYEDFLPGRGPSAEQNVGNAELQRVFLEHIQAFAANLDERERKILEQRVLADEPRTLQEMGDEFGVSRERVRQLEARLVKRLREYLRENMVDFEYYTAQRT